MEDVIFAKVLACLFQKLNYLEVDHLSRVRGHILRLVKLKDESSKKLIFCTDQRIAYSPLTGNKIHWSEVAWRQIL